MLNPNSVLKTCCIVSTFVASNLACAMADSTGAGNSASEPPSNLSGKPSTLLRSSAQDTEKMERSVKLLIPAAVPPPPPRQLQTGAQQSFLNPPVYSTPITPPQNLPRQFQLDTQANRPFKAPPRAPFLTPALPSGIRGPGGIWTYSGIAPTIVPRRMWTPPRPQPQTVPQYMSVQVDPWTNVREGESTRAIQIANFQTAIKRLHSTPQTAAQNGTQLMAIQKVLPSMSAPKSWNEWYKRVAEATYDRWKQNTAGPGAAIVLIKVFNSRAVDCRITEFTPAAGAERDADSEQKFKQVALQCVSSLSGDEIWQFPPISPIPKQISFDMEFKHAVGENAGCSVVHMHLAKTSP